MADSVATRSPVPPAGVVSSSALNIFRVNSEVNKLIVVKLDDVTCKCVCIPVMSKNDHFIVSPLLH